MPLDRSHYAKLATDELQRRWDRLQDDASAFSVGAECARMFALQEIAAVLSDRETLPA